MLSMLLTLQEAIDDDNDFDISRGDVVFGLIVVLLVVAILAIWNNSRR